VRAAILLGLWSIPGLIQTSQAYFLWTAKDPPPSLWLAFIWQMPPWLFWALVTPFIVAVCRRYPLEGSSRAKAIGLHLLVNLTAAPIHMFIASVTGRLAGQEFYVTRPFGEVMGRMLARNALAEVLMYWSLVALINAFDYHRRYREIELTQARLETQLAQAELRALKMQLHPHFLFNTLHTIGVLVRKQETQGSLRMLSGLSDLLRMALENVGRQVVSLKQELDFLERYLAIERTRFQDRLSVRMSIEPETLDAQIPNLILQPIVENAIRHGIAPRAAAGRVEITASARGDKLSVTVRDDGVGIGKKGDARRGQGVGLANVRARLAQLYPKAHTFSIEDHPEGGALVTIEVPLRRAPEEQAADEPNG
jgi:signal transduction histidine kinase